MRNATATKICFTATCLLSLALLACGAAQGQEYWVSTTGNDAAAGTKEKPFATLERARAAVRKAKKGGLPEGDITVWLQGGVYELSKTFALEAADGGTEKAPVVYRAAPGADVRLIGGKQIPSSAFSLITDPAILERLDPDARGKVLQADLRAQGISDFGDFSGAGGLQLIFQDRQMPLSRWPREGWMNIVDLVGGRPFEGDESLRDVGKFSYEGDRPSRWVGEKGAWAHGYWAWDYHDGRQRIESIDTKQRVISLAPPNHRWGYRKGQRFYVFNLLSEINSPAGWCLDRERGMLYFWTPGPIGRGEAVVTLLQAPLVTLDDCSYVTIRGLTLEASRGTGVTLVGGAHNRIVGCTLRNLGGNAVTIKDGAANGVVGCEISGTGSGGISLTGGDRKTLTPAGHYAENNHIHHYGTWNRTYNSAISLEGVGNRASHNLIHDAPHMAIIFSGNDHAVEYNEIYRVCTETGDAGAVYVGRDWTQRGSLVRHNYFHDISASMKGGQGFSSVMAVYLDDWTSGITVFGNIFSGADYAIMLGGGRDNVIENNVFVGCNLALSLDARGLDWAKSYFDGRDNTLFDRLKAVNHDRPPYSERYPALANILNDEPVLPKGNVIAHNICTGGEWARFVCGATTDDVKKLFKMENNLTEGDVGMVAPAKRDFQLKDDSPALKLGFKPLPLEKIGLYKDEYRPQIMRGE